MIQDNPKQNLDSESLTRIKEELERIDILKRKNDALLKSSYRAWKWMIVKQFVKKNQRIISLVLLLSSWVIACVTDTMLGAIIGSIVGIIAGPVGVLIGSVVGIVVDYFF